MTDSIPEEFSKVIKDFVGDIRTTFPEYETFINKWWKTNNHFNNIDDEEERKTVIKTSEKKSIKFLFNFCKKKFPPRFFDILYQNNDMFKEESDIDTEFLPNIHFKNLWQCEISDKTRDTIWKYLQLIIFSIVGTLENKDAFGDTAKMFEAINEDEFKTKLEETLSQMQGFFDLSSNFNFYEKGSEGFDNDDEINMKNMHDATQIQDHIAGMFDGKLGQLAREIAEDTASNLNIEFDDATDMKDIFQKLLKNPAKLMGLVKTVGDKLDSKIKSGDLKESELITEATEMMNKMKNMPGMGNIQTMLSKMGMGGVGGKVNMAAMESNLNQKMKMAKTKERIRAKAEANAKAKAESLLAAQLLFQQQQQQQEKTDEEILNFINSEEKPEKTPRGIKLEENNNNKNNNNKKKKNKK
jgi:hypothetical protein